MHDAILNALREEAENKAEKQFASQKPPLKDVLVEVFVEAYIAGGASVLQKELIDRMIDQVDKSKKKKHNHKLKTAYKKAPAK